MLRNPRKTLQSVNNCVTVALPLTSIDVEQIVNQVVEIVGSPAISDMTDVDFDTYGLEDGAILVYNGVTQQWQSTTYIDRQHIDAGEY